MFRLIRWKGDQGMTQDLLKVGDVYVCVCFDCFGAALLDALHEGNDLCFGVGIVVDIRGSHAANGANGA